jgi:hypothetical protein
MVQVYFVSEDTVPDSDLAEIRGEVSEVEGSGARWWWVEAREVCA